MAGGDLHLVIFLVALDDLRQNLTQLTAIPKRIMIGVGGGMLLNARKGNTGRWKFGLWLTILTFSGFGAVLFAQSVISAKSGIVHYVEGQVTLDGQPPELKFGHFPDVKTGQVLATTEGRAEVLLTPGVFLRLAENSSIRMVSKALADTRVAVVSGTALIEAVELPTGNSVTVEVRDTRIGLPKRGIYRIDAGAALLRVYDGEAILNPEANSIKVKKNREVDLDAAKLATRNFDAKSTDPFYRWSSRRASYITAANASAARTAERSSYGSGFFGRSSSQWAYNPLFGMFTFMPRSGFYMSPFGSSYLYGDPFYGMGPGIGIYLPRPRPMTPLPAPVNPLGGIAGPPSAGVIQPRVGGRSPFDGGSAPSSGLGGGGPMQGPPGGGMGRMGGGRLPAGR